MRHNNRPDRLKRFFPKDTDFASVFESCAQGAILHPLLSAKNIATATPARYHPSPSSPNDGRIAVIQR
jgi:hypothetical protein